MWYVKHTGGARKVRNFVRSVIAISKKHNYQLVEHYANSLGTNCDTVILKNKKIKSYEFVEYNEPYWLVKLTLENSSTVNFEIPYDFENTFYEKNQGLFGIEWINSGPHCWIMCESSYLKRHKFK